MEEEKPKTDKKISFLILGIILISAALFLWINKDRLFVSTQEKEVDNVLQNKNIIINTDNQENQTFYLFGKFKMNLVSGWKQTKGEDTLIKMSGTKIHFELSKENTACIIAYAEVPIKTLGEYKQTSFAGKVYTADGDQQWDSWYLREDLLPNNFEFLWEGRQPLKNEVRINYYPLFYNNPEPGYHDVFLVFSKDGSPVSSECDSDFSKMLSSVRRVFETTDLTDKSAGIINFQKMSSNFPLQLMFLEENGDGIEREVLRFDTLIMQPTVYQNKIFFVSGGKLKTLDIFTKEINDVAGMFEAEKEVVNNFYIVDGRLFYLFGLDCNDYMAKCSLKLFEYDFNTEKSNFLAEGVTSRVIVGYNKSRNSLGMYHGEGDAGCYWMSEEQYKFSTKKLESGDNFSGCSGENQNGESSTTPDEITKFNEFKLIFDNGIITGGSMRVKDGKIILPSSKQDTGNWPIRYVTQ